VTIYRVSDIWQIEIHTSEPLLSEHSPAEVQTIIAKLKTYELPNIDQIPVQLIQAGCETLRSEIHKLISSIWNKAELPE
jgi:hypothetical protein